METALYDMAGNSGSKSHGNPPVDVVKDMAIYDMAGAKTKPLGNHGDDDDDDDDGHDVIVHDAVVYDMAGHGASKREEAAKLVAKLTLTGSPAVESAYGSNGASAI